MLNCPSCKRIIIDTTSDGGAKIRSRMIIVNGDVAQALCPTCKTRVVIPISLNMDKLPPPGNQLKHFIQT